MTDQTTTAVLEHASISPTLRQIAAKVLKAERITAEEGILLYEQAELGFLGMLANTVRERKQGKKTFFNKNFHIEPTNICIYNCKFCSYARKIRQTDTWEFSLDEIANICTSFKDKGVSEVHIVGGVHPQRDLHYYGQLIQRVKSVLPTVHIKAFTAIELDFMIRKSKMSIEEGLKALKAYGLDSIPGGGAEIFHPDIRSQICDDKSEGDMWLNIHQTAHSVGIPSNATMLYGHIEAYTHRVDHMERLRQLQDKTNGFNCFIPLKYRKENNQMQHLGEVSVVEDLRNYAVSRIYLDNFAHVKAYWPMIGKQVAQMALGFGVDDVDGTIDDTTKIYSMAGVEDQSPKMSTEDICKLIKGAGYQPIERDSVYNELKVY